METVQQVQPQFIDTERIIKTPKILFRADYGDFREYYSITNNGDLKFYSGVTSALDLVMQKPEWLIKWIARLGEEEAERQKFEKSHYGTLEHICLSSFSQNNKFALSSIPARVETYKIANKLSFKTDYWGYELEKDLRAWELFASIHEIKPIAIGIQLASDELGIAGEIDIVLEMRVGTGVNGNILKTDIKVDKKTGLIVEDKTSQKIVIMDWKSGRHGFSDSNAAQLHLYKLLWDENFPHLPIDALFNWAPKEWREEPDYILKDQTSSVEKDCIPHYLNLFNIKKRIPKPSYLSTFEGELQLGKRNGNFTVMTQPERVKFLHNRIHPKMKIEKIIDNEELIIDNEKKEEPGDMKDFIDTKTENLALVNIPALEKAAQKDSSKLVKDIIDLF